MAWHSFLPKLTVQKKVIFENGKLNALWYFLHLPIIVYAVILLALQKQYSEIVSNSPFLMVNVDPLDAPPYFLGSMSNFTEDPSTTSWCAVAGGPFPCNSTPQVQAACVELLTEDILLQLGGIGSMYMTTICTRLCDLDKLNAPDCMVPPSLFRAQGSTSLQIIPYTAFNQGLFSGGNRNIMVQLHPLLRFAPVTFSYSYQMSRSAPFFFGTDPNVADRKTGADSYTVAVTVTDKVTMVFNPGEAIIIPPPAMVSLAGIPWDLALMTVGGEFYAVVNCYTDSYDFPSALDWSGHSRIEPSLQVPVCLLTLEQLRPASGVKQVDTLADVAQAAAQIRVDTGRGSSFHRLPSLAAIVLNLISLIVLLKFPTIVTIVFATNCLGSLSNVYKRAQQETFDVSTRVAQLMLRLLSDTMAFGPLVDPTTGVSKAKLKEQLDGILQNVAPAQENPGIIAEDVSDHIFKMLRKMPQLGSKEDAVPHGSHLATLMSRGQAVELADLCAYFDPARRRSWLEWFLLPFSQRKLIKERRKQAKELAQATTEGGKSKNEDTEAKEESEIDVEVENAEMKEIETLQEEISQMLGQVRVIKERQAEEDREEERQEEVENQVQRLYVAVETLMQRIDRFEAEGTASTSRDGLATLTKGTKALEARVLKFEEENLQLSEQIQALHAWADAHQAQAMKELEDEARTAVAISSSASSRPQFQT